MSYWKYLKQRKVFRWYLILLPILWLAIILSYGWWDHTNVIADYWAIILWLLQSALVFFMITMSGVFMIRMYRLHIAKPNTQALPDHLHLILLSIYNEPIAVIERSLDSILSQSLSAKKHVVIVLGIEQKRGDFVAVKQYFLNRYADCFRFFYVTEHPYGLSGEIPGKCSNERWSAIFADQQLKKDCPQISTADIIMTTMDSDTLFHAKMLETLSVDYYKQDGDKRHEIIWQAGQFFNWDLAKRPFFTRITALYRTIWMVGFNIPLSVNSMAVYSSSFKLCKKNDYFCASYQMEDMYYCVSCMGTTKGRLKIRPIYLPLLCGPTSGDNLKEEIKEWAIQGRRWSIGAFEIFHVIVANVKKLGIFKTLRYLGKFFMMYAAFQCVLALVTLLSFPFWAMV